MSQTILPGIHLKFTIQSLNIRIFYMFSLIIKIKGPCQIGEWFVLDSASGFPKCEFANGCPTDGNYAYWSPNFYTAKRCWRLYRPGPCPYGEYLRMNERTFEVTCKDTGDLCRYYFTNYNSDDDSQYSAACGPFSAAPLRRGKLQCRLGTFRNQSGCRRSFI